MRPGHLLIVCVLGLLSLGVVMVQSAGMSVGAEHPGASAAAIALSRPTAYLALALLAMGVASWIPAARLLPDDRIALGPVLIVPLALAASLLVYAPNLGREVNGSSRWIGIDIPHLGAMSFQPSEVAKWGSVLFVAWFGAWRGARMKQLGGGLLLGLAPIALLAGVVMIEDLGTAALIGVVAVVTLLAAGAKVKHALLLAPAGALAVAAGVLAEPYRVRRLMAFAHPFADPAGSGYHAIQSMAAVAGGAGFGRGLGFGLQKFGYLPEDQTDFIFAIIAEELGLAGAALVIALYLGLLWSGWSIIRREQSPVLRLVGLGVLTTIGLQAIINLAAVTGLGPTKGIALPLISSGGTGWALTAASLGLLVGMDRTQARAEARSMDAGAGQRPAPRSGASGDTLVIP